MLLFEGFSLALQETSPDNFQIDIIGHSTKFSLSGLSPSGLIKMAKFECLKVLADQVLSSCFIVEKKTGNITYKNMPLTHKESSLSGFELQGYTEGVAFVNGLESGNPVTMTISVIDYGAYLKCQIDSIKNVATLLEAHP